MIAVSIARFCQGLLCQGDSAVPAYIQWPFRTNFPKQSEESATSTVLLSVEIKVVGRCKVYRVRSLTVVS